MTVLLQPQTKTISSYYAFYGINVCISSNSKTALDSLELIYNPFKIAHTDVDLDFKLEFIVENENEPSSDNVRIRIAVKEERYFDLILMNHEANEIERNNGFIVFEAKPKHDVQSWFSYIETTLFNFTVYWLQRFMQIHAACVARGGSAVMLTGASRSGKTTLSYVLANNGFKFLTDELTLIDTDTLHAYSFPRNPLLRKDVYHLFDERSIVRTNNFGRFKADEKYCAIVDPRSVQEIGSPVKVRLLIFPQYKEGVGAELEKMPGSDAFTGLFTMNSIVNFNYKSSNRAILPDVVARMMDNISAYRLKWGNSEAAVECIKELVDGCSCSEVKKSDLAGTN